MSSAVLSGVSASFLFTSADEIRVHPINQAGSSSNEGLDIDIVENNLVRMAIEVKDKPFTRSDIEHAVLKCVDSGVRSMTFLIGPNSEWNSEAIDSALKTAVEKGVLVSIDFVSNFAMLGIGWGVPSSENLSTLFNQFCKDARVKDKTIQHINDSLHISTR